MLRGVLIALLAAVVALAAAGTPRRPQPADVFETHFHLSVRSPTSGDFSGDGIVTADTPNNHLLETYVLHFSTEQVNEYLLWRFDLGFAFLIINNGACQRGALNSSTMPDPWEWVQYASFDGTRRSPSHQTLDYWYLQDTEGRTRELGVFHDNVNVPAWDSFNSTSGAEQELSYTVWQTQKPPSSTFTVPNSCSSAVEVPLSKLARASKGSRFATLFQ